MRVLQIGEGILDSSPLYLCSFVDFLSATLKKRKSVGLSSIFKSALQHFQHTNDKGIVPFPGEVGLVI